MRDRLGPGDLLAGAVAAGGLLLFVYAFDMRLLLAIPLAVATYLGVALLQPKVEPRRDEPVDDAGQVDAAYQTALANAAAIRALEPRIAKPAVCERVGRIADLTDRILAAIDEDGNLDAAALFNRRLLRPSGSLLTEYVRLSTRGVRSADGLLEQTEACDLPMIEQAFADFYETLHRESQERLLAASSEVPPQVRTDALLMAGNLALRAGDYDGSTRLLKESLALARRFADPLATAKALLLLGYLAEDSGDLEQHVPLFEEALARFREVDDPWWVPETLAGLGRVARERADDRQAWALLEEALTLHRDHGNRWGIAWVTTALGEVAADGGDAGQAAAYFLEGIRLQAEHKSSLGIGVCLLGLGKLAGASGRPETAAQLLGAAEALRDERGLILPLNHRESHDCCVARARADLGEAAFAAAWAAGRAMTVDQAVDAAADVAVEREDVATPSSQPAVAAHGLTPRELEVLCLLAEDRSNQDIADLLFISRRTVTTHVDHILAKLSVDSRTGAVAFALRHGLC